MKIDKPSYYIKYDTNNSLFMLAINGFVLKEEWAGDKNNYEEPINHHIKNGDNLLQFIPATKEVYDELFEENSRVNYRSNIEVRVKGFTNNQAVDYHVTDIVFNPSFTDNFSEFYYGSSASGNLKFNDSENDTHSSYLVSDITKGQEYYDDLGPTLNRKFQVVVPFPNWSFFNADKVIDFPLHDHEFDTYETLIQKEIDKAVEIFDTRDIDKILPMFEMRSKEIDQAFYKEPGSTQNDIRHSLDVVFNEQKFEQSFVQDKNRQFVTSLDGRLLSRVDAGLMAGTIFFRDEQTGTSIFYTIYWMRKDGEWIIAR